MKSWMVYFQVSTLASPKKIKGFIWRAEWCTFKFQPLPLQKIEGFIWRAEWCTFKFPPLPLQKIKGFIWRAEWCTFKFPPLPLWKTKRIYMKSWMVYFQVSTLASSKSKRIYMKSWMVYFQVSTLASSKNKRIYMKSWMVYFFLSTLASSKNECQPRFIFNQLNGRSLRMDMPGPLAKSNDLLHLYGRFPHRRVLSSIYPMRKPPHHHPPCLSLSRHPCRRWEDVNTLLRFSPLPPQKPPRHGFIPGSPPSTWTSFRTVSTFWPSSPKSHTAQNVTSLACLVRARAV